jgi:hypothetical protein
MLELEQNAFAQDYTNQLSILADCHVTGGIVVQL